jgi:hypothetical protein
MRTFWLVMGYLLLFYIVGDLVVTKLGPHTVLSTNWLYFIGLVGSVLAGCLHGERLLCRDFSHE